MNAFEENPALLATFPVHYEPKKEVGKILFRAAEILGGGWCQKAYARGKGGFIVALGDATPGVDGFCLTGAILKAVMEHEGVADERNLPVLLHPLALAAFDALHRVIRDSALAHWNDLDCPSGEVAVAKVREAAHALEG